MNVGLFGGTFDPIHRGHLALARAAQEHYKLGRILFVPANNPPHKLKQPLSPFSHRYAMITLATGAEKDFVPSLLEAPEALDALRSRKEKEKEIKPNYTIDTVKRLKQSFKKADRLFLLIGIDAFADIAKWHQAEALFRECEFVVASRPGYSLADVANALPPSLRPRAEATKPFQKQAATGDLVLSGVTIHLLDDVYQPVSSTAIRQAAAAGKPLGRSVEPAVADYIKKVGLYKNGAKTGAETSGFPQE
jgi:nicotinate-nucleotide adenylyltransferase